MQAQLPPLHPPLALALVNTPTGAEDEGEKCREFRATSAEKCPNWSQKKGESERGGGELNPKTGGEKFPP